LDQCPDRRVRSQPVDAPAPGRPDAPYRDTQGAPYLHVRHRRVAEQEEQELLVLG